MLADRSAEYQPRVQEALEWFHLAADQGHAEAQFKLSDWASSLRFRRDNALPCNRPLEYGTSYLSKKSGAVHDQPQRRARRPPISQ